MYRQNRWKLAILIVIIAKITSGVNGALDGSGRCGAYECRSSNPICRCESFCQEWSQRCWKSPTGCHCARGYARDNHGNCIPLTLCP
ncbi:uncharacterized protein Dana_GF22425 [Drosophila ananassae]|uniref:TIL domain-containing protein n=1 Tax=Drosophila ananassae TaxID=7217 RepID=B3MWM6_DROAN|nr:uncharacterized protein LOC6505086 [Drosophila ananassae]XP_044573351.1 uncharacterized protein LOC6505086 [Drosophila ananassae]EDV35011.1 uncharacterized protein Dana_GF22425 [Drosophila ananassae]